MSTDTPVANQRHSGYGVSKHFLTVSKVHCVRWTAYLTLLAGPRTCG